MMTKTTYTIKLLLSLYCLILSIQFCHADIAVITHPKNSSELNIEDIRLRFLGKHLHKDSPAHNITPINLPFGHPSRASFDKKVLDKSEANIRTYWARMIFTSRARPPIEFKDEAQIIDFITKHQDSIGYINTDLIDSRIKVLFTFPTASKKASK